MPGRELVFFYIEIRYSHGNYRHAKVSAHKMDNTIRVKVRKRSSGFLSIFRVAFSLIHTCENTKKPATSSSSLDPKNVQHLVLSNIPNIFGILI